MPYGAWSLEGIDSNGDWIASAPAQLALRAHSTIRRSRFLVPPPRDDVGTARWRNDVQVLRVRLERDLARCSNICAWHVGGLDDASTRLARGADSIDFATPFNTRRDRSGKELPTSSVHSSDQRDAKLAGSRSVRGPLTCYRFHDARGIVCAQTSTELSPQSGIRVR